jgi:glycosyltransferase involved in cell wall biosynthesis
VEAARRAGLQPRTIGWSRRKPVLRATRELARILREVKADVVHTYNIYADLVGLLAARLVGAKVLSTVFVWSDFGWKRNLLQHADRWVLQFFDLVTAQCEKTRRDTIERGLPSERTQVLISGFPPPPTLPDPAERSRLRRAMGIEDGQIVLANFARLYPEKAQDVLLQSFAMLRANHPEAQLWIFGTGPLEASLRSLASRLGLDGAMKFIGFVDAPFDYLRLLDIQVHPSHAEGVPLALCEGLAAGLPVVASAVGGVPEVLDEGRCGILLPPAGDSGFRDAFLETISRLMVHPEERARLGAAGREFIRTGYSVRTAVDNLERTYMNLVGPCASVSS